MQRSFLDRHLMTRSDKLISRDELLAGFQGGDKRRAATAISLIEARTARLTIERGRVNSPYVPQSAFQERNQAFFSAITDGARGPIKVSIQDLERHADEWLLLVPEKPEIRAEMARILGETYSFSKAQAPKIAAALGLASPEVIAAFDRFHKRPIETIYSDRFAPLETLRWAWLRVGSRLEALPPFWTAFALTLTEIVGAGTLALPIAFATIGPLAGAGLLILLGLINILTVGYLAEASARNGSILYGSAFIGQLVGDFMGPFAVFIVRLGLFCFCCNVLVAYYTGFATTISAITGLPNALWVFVISGFGVFLILRKSLIGTVSSALVIGFINISILIVLSIVALTHISFDNLTHVKVPFLFDEPFDASLLQLVFGIVMTSYFGHVSVSNCAQAVLRREPDGRSLKTGTMAAMAVAMVIYTVWAISIGSVIDPSRLASESGTALVPLTEKAGFGVLAIGTVFVILGLGMGSVHFSLGIFNMARELFVGGKTEKALLRRFKFAQSISVPNLLSLLPLMAIFGYVQFAFYSGQYSFIKPLELNGSLLTPLLAGLFPVLLLVVSRRRGRAIGGAKLSSLLTHPILLGAIALLYFSSLILHATLIWTDPLSQGLAFVAAVIMVVCILELVGKRAFRSRVLVEINYLQETNDQISVNATYKGEALDYTTSCTTLDGEIKIYASGEKVPNYSQCRELSIELADTPASVLQVQAFRVSQHFEAEPLSGELVFENSFDKQTRHTYAGADLSHIVSLPSGPKTLTLRPGASTAV